MLLLTFYSFVIGNYEIVVDDLSDIEDFPSAFNKFINFSPSVVGLDNFRVNYPTNAEQNTKHPLEHA